MTGSRDDPAQAPGTLPEMGADPVVPWATCAEPECNGARAGAAPTCLVHLPPEELTRTLTAGGGGAGVDLDGRGVHFDRDSLQRVLDALPKDDSGHQLLGTVRFDQAVFDHGLSLDSASFAGEVSMVGALFKGDARFGGAAFGGPGDFSEATFEGQAWFVGAQFGGPASFRATKFRGPGWFQQATFAAEAWFDGAVFSANATISSARFDSVASFCGAGFDRRARFDRSTSAGGWRFDEARFREEPEGLPAGAVRPVAPKVSPPESAPLEGRAPTARTRAPKARRRFTALLQVLALLTGLAVIAYIVLREDQKTTTFTDYAFLLANPKTGAPARWNPCEPIRYVVNAEHAPFGAVEDLNLAIAEITKATGITFQSEGATTEKITLNVDLADLAPPMDEPQGGSTTSSSSTSTTLLGAPEDPKVYAMRVQEIFKRPAYQPDRYGKDRWAPLLLTWSLFPEIPEEFRPGLLGIGAGEPRDIGGGNSVFVTGIAMFNATATQEFARATMMHEIGHVMGLAHVASGDELMLGTERRQSSFGNGDLEGFRRLGVQAGCLPTPPAKA